MEDMSLSDAELVEQVRRGRLEAFGELVSRHQECIYNTAYYLVGNDEDAQDVAQDVFLKAYRNIGTFERKAKFSTWLYGIMLNTVRSVWRKQGLRSGALSLSARPEDEAAAADPESEREGPVHATVRAETVAAVRGAIEELEGELKEILVLRDIEGLSYEDIAEALGVPLGTVKSRIFRARYCVKEKLRPVFGKEP